MVLVQLSGVAPGQFWNVAIDFSSKMLVLAAVAYWIFPLILTLPVIGAAMNFTPALNMITAFPYFIMMLPLFVTFFGAYAVSRLWDLSWGNRASEDEEKRRAGEMARLKHSVAPCVCLVMFLNLVAYQLTFEVKLKMCLVFFGIGFLQMFFSFLYNI